ncbi:hypothetical protein D9M68_732050 [compost metagenome]
MRDNGTHTELLLAGLWGVVCGALPPLEVLTRKFLRTPIESQHFADQYFLRQYVWPYARQSLLQHDSVFGFLNAAEFPGGKTPSDFHVGYAEGSPYFTAQSDLPDGTPVWWALLRSEVAGSETREDVICRYPATVHNKLVRAHIPARYTRWIEEGIARIHVTTGETP